MDKSNIITIILIAAALGFSFYRRYTRKAQDKDGKGTHSGSFFSLKSKDDDYEPYSGK